MPEKKQYFDQQLDKGKLLINENVLETIVFNATRDVEGVAGFSSKPAKDLIGVLGKKNAGKALNIKITAENQLQVDCNINVLYGHNVICVAKSIQAAIWDALESSVKVTVVAVNVNICGIVCK